MRSTYTSILSILAVSAACTAEPAPEIREFLPGATIIGSDPACFDCSVELELFTDLQESRDQPLIDGNAIRSLLRTPEGILVTTGVAGPPMLFDLEGHFVRTVGTRGQELGNFISATLMRQLRGDSVAVYDELAHVLTLFRPGLRPVRHVPLDDVRVTDFVGLTNGDLLVAAPLQVGDSTYPVRRLSGIDGGVIGTPGGALASRSVSDPAQASRLLARSRDGRHFWSAHALRYAIEKRTLDGELVATLERDVDWFPPAARVAAVSDSAPPTPVIAAIWEDGRGLLWVHTLTPDGRWQNALNHVRALDGTEKAVVASRDLYLDSRIEVIDPDNGTLLVTAKFDPELPTFAVGPMLSRIGIGPTGLPVAEIWTLRLVGLRSR